MYFFAYGTLQPGGNLEFFEQSDLKDFLKSGRSGSTPGSLFHLRNTRLSIEYPGLIPGATGVVFGTLYTVDEPDKALAIMDEHELKTEDEHGNSVALDLFFRGNCSVALENGTSVSAVAYLMNPDSSFLRTGVIQNVGPIPSGNWLSYIKR